MTVELPAPSGDAAETGAAVGVRDTDADWRSIGAEQPFWGVLTEDKYRAEVMTPGAMDAFYATGRDDVTMFAYLIGRASGTEPKCGQALDFGCGVGRLSEAMVAYADGVTGVDISPGMLAQARARSGDVTYVDALPERSFDWINCHIVFQHIPSERGMEMVDALLDRLAPEGAVSLQFPFARVDKPAPAQADPPGVMQMYDYDLPLVLERLRARGVGRMLLHPTDHGGHLGFLICGRRTDA